MPLDPKNLPEHLKGCEEVLGSPNYSRYLELLDPTHKDYEPRCVRIIRITAGLERAIPADVRPLESTDGQFTDLDEVVSPTRTHQHPRSWEGLLIRKPWNYKITAVIPHLDTPDLLRIVVETLRLQTERPYIVVVDTGSLAVHRAEVEKLETEDADVEVHYLRFRGWPRICDPVCVAMDLGFAAARTEYVYSTHTDVFLKNRDHLAFLLSHCGPKTPAVGHRMFPRGFAGPEAARMARSMLGHCSTLYHLPTCRRIGLSWNYERQRERLGLSPAQCRNGWPDTEVGPGLCFLDAGFGYRRLGESAPKGDHPRAVLAVGEEGEGHHEDARLEHPRSWTGRRLFDRSGSDVHDRNIADAVGRATARLEEWRKTPLPVPVQEAPLLTLTARTNCGTCGGQTPAPDAEAEPSLLRQLASAAAAFAKWLASGGKTVPPETADWRMSLCRKCDRFEAESVRCRECRCFLEWKTKMPAEACPIGKWPADVPSPASHSQSS